MGPDGSGGPTAELHPVGRRNDLDVSARRGLRRQLRAGFAVQRPRPHPLADQRAPGEADPLQGADDAVVKRAQGVFRSGHRSALAACGRFRRSRRSGGAQRAGGATDPTLRAADDHLLGR